jgi:SAM-dependent methyltransferase
MIDYNHALNLHTLDGPRIALPLLLQSRQVKSVLDVGCGTGTWMRAAIDSGIEQVRGIDGIAVGEDFHATRSHFEQVNFEQSFDLGQRFDLVICFEVAEHLEETAAEGFIQSICRHTDDVLFSAACPGQPGQHHVNCQWPEYWQTLFNKCGFICSDEARWRVWDCSPLEVWYRQNMFTASRCPDRAGRELRLHRVIHPEFVSAFTNEAVETDRQQAQALIDAGTKPMGWYVMQMLNALLMKISRKLGC